MPRNLTASDRKSLIKLASTMSVGSEERRAILAGLSDLSAVAELEIPEPPHVSVPKLTESQRDYMVSALSEYPNPVITGRGKTSPSLRALGLLTPPEFLPLSDSGYSGDFYSLTKEGFKVAQVLLYESAVARWNTTFEKARSRGWSSDHVQKLKDRQESRAVRGLGKRWVR